MVSCRDGIVHLVAKMQTSWRVGERIEAHTLLTQLIRLKNPLDHDKFEIESTEEEFGRSSRVTRCDDQPNPPAATLQHLPSAFTAVNVRRMMLPRQGISFNRANSGAKMCTQCSLYILGEPLEPF